MKKTAIYIQPVALIIFFFISCSPFISIPRVNYSELNGASKVVIIMTSGQKITTSHFWISEDTLFISEPGQLFYKGRQDTLLFDEIQEIRDYKNARLHPLAEAGVKIVGMGMLLFVALALYVLYEFSTGEN